MRIFIFLGILIFAILILIYLPIVTTIYLFISLIIFFIGVAKSKEMDNTHLS